MYEYHTNRENHKKVKQWAKDAGYPIPGNSMVSKAMMEAYNIATNEKLEYFAHNTRPKGGVSRKKRRPAEKAKPDFFFTGNKPTRRAQAEPLSDADKKAKYLRPPR